MEKLKRQWRDIATTTVILLLVCLITTFAVSAAETAFADKIAEQNAKTLSESMSRLIEADEYTVVIEDDEGEAIAYAASTSSGEPLGYIVTTEATGYGGAVSVMTAFTTDGEVIAIEVVEVSDETPGLGQNATNESFTSQFSGLTQAPGLVKATQPGNNEVQALTGATITSKAVVKAVTDAFEIYSQLS